MGSERCIRDRDTANGVAVDGRRHGAGSTCLLPEAGATLQLGQTRLRLRLPGETLAAEKPLPAAAAVATPWLLGLALLALALAELGLGLDPGADLPAWLPVGVGPPGACPQPPSGGRRGYSRWTRGCIGVAPAAGRGPAGG